MLLQYKKQLLFCLFFYQTTSLFPQNIIAKQEQRTPLSVSETWLRAIESSKKVNLSALEASVSKEEIRESQYERFPEVSLKGNYEYATNIPVYENGLFHSPTQHEVIHLLYKLSTDFYVNIYNGNKLNLKIDKKKTLYEISEIQKGLTVSEIKLQASVYYLNLQKNLIFKKLIVNDIANQEKQLFEIKELYKHGVNLKSDVLRAELQLSNQKMILVRIENDISIANQRLNILIGSPDHEILDPYEELDPALFDLKSYDEYLEIAENNSYEYHISEKGVALKKIELRNVKANVRPKIGFSGEFYLANPQIFLYPYSPSNYTLGVFGVRASIPLSELFVNKPKERVARLNLEKEELEHHHTDDRMREQVYENYLRFKESLLQINVAKTDIEQSVENARIVRENYFNQTALITDLLDADIQLLQSRFNFASAKINAQIQYYQLQNVLGTL